MGFLSPKIPTPTAAAKPANPAMDPLDPATGGAPGGTASAAASLINTGARGLSRRASTQRVSLLGGA